MSLEPSASSSIPRTLLALLPPILAVLVHFPAWNAPFTLDDAVIAEKREALSDASPRRLFLETYLTPGRVDTGYRPVTYLTYAWNYALGDGAAPFRAVNLALHALVSAIAFLLLAELLGDSRLAAAGASLYAVLPVHADAVDRILGRAEIISGLCVLGAVLAALKSRRGGQRGERLPLVLAAGGLTFAALFAREDAGMAVPFLVAAACMFLRRPVPWLAVGASVCAVLGSLAVRGLVFEGRMSAVRPIENPFAAAGIVKSALNGVSLIGAYAAKVALPLRLQAEYLPSDVRVLPVSSALPWLWAAAVCAVLGIAWVARRRCALEGLAVWFFALALVPVANLVTVSDRPFAERAAYTAAIAFPLLVFAALSRLALSRRAGFIAAAAAALVAAYGARTWARAREWADPEAMRRLVMEQSPGRLEDHFHSLIDTLQRLDSMQARACVERFRAEAAGAIARDASDPWAHALAGHLLYQEGQYGAACEPLLKAASLAAAKGLPADLLLCKLAGESLSVNMKDAQALPYLEKHIALVERAGGRPDASVLHSRGLSLARQNRLSEALRDFDAALALNEALPEYWNDRGFCKFKLNDLGGAISDYKRGLEICEKSGILYLPRGESVHAFALRLADVHDAIARYYRENGKEELAKPASEEAVSLRKQAAELVPRT